MAKRDSRSKSSSAVGVAAIVLIAIPILYLLPFVAVFLDELVFGTHFFASNMPPWFEDAFQIVYWPIMELFFR